uniref:Uncharacterized protein n=1 Tax=Romanomermis culicivorax TaxID=13658 RepID=A0A915IB57_ROMCU
MFRYTSLTYITASESSDEHIPLLIALPTTPEPKGIEFPFKFSKSSLNTLTLSIEHDRYVFRWSYRIYDTCSKNRLSECIKKLKNPQIKRL